MTARATGRDPTRHLLPALSCAVGLLFHQGAMQAAAPIEYDRTRSFQVELAADSIIGEASIREHAIAWHPVKRKYYLVADVVPLASQHHPNTYGTEIHLWSSPDLAKWKYHGVAVEKGTQPRANDKFGVASPAGMTFTRGKLYVPFSARRTKRFEQRGIGLAWSGADPEDLPWTKSSHAISDLEGEDDDPAVLTVAGDQRVHLYHRRTGPGGYRIVHSSSATPEQPGAWPAARPITPRPATVRAQELTGAFVVNEDVHLLVIEHLVKGGMKIAHLVSDRPEGPFSPADPTQRYLSAGSQPNRVAYGGHISPVVRGGRAVAFFWTAHQQRQRYGLLGHPVRQIEKRQTENMSVEQLAPRIRAMTFHSHTLDRDKTFCVVLPRKYDQSGGPWPVLVLFHGRGRHERTLIDDQRSRELLLAAPFVTVLPDGDDGWYINSPVQSGDRYQTYVEEVIDAADSHFNLSPQRQSRGLSGWSMGGYGCTLYAETHAKQFAAVAPIIGLLDFPRRGLPDGQSYEVPIERFGSDPKDWRRLNPITQAERLKNTSVLVISADQAFDRMMNENFTRRLKHLGVKHEWRLLKGKHTFDNVRQALPIVIDFMNQSLEISNE